MTVPTECFFPRPQQGQSLTSFLSSNEFNISAELDRVCLKFYYIIYTISSSFLTMLVCRLNNCIIC